MKDEWFFIKTNYKTESADIALIITKTGHTGQAFRYDIGVVITLRSTSRWLGPATVSTGSCSTCALSHSPFEVLRSVLKVSHVGQNTQHLFADHADQFIGHRFVDDVMQLVQWPCSPLQHCVQVAPTSTNNMQHFGVKQIAAGRRHVGSSYVGEPVYQHAIKVP